MSSPPEELQNAPSPPDLQFNLADNNQAVDSALRLIASPLLPAARAAAEHPFPVDDLNNQDIEDFCFNPSDIDDFLLLDTQYIQLNPQSTTPPPPPANQPSPPAPTVTTNPVQTLPTPPTSSAPQPTASTPRRRPSPKHTRRSPLSTSTPAHVPIAPRSHAPGLPKRTGPQFEHNGPARLLERRSTLLHTASSQSLPLRPSPVSFPSPPLAPGMIPLINMASMYPLQPHTHIFQPPQAQKEPSVAVPGQSENKKRRVENPTPTAVPNQCLPSHVPIVSPTVVPYDPSVMPLIQMTQMQQMYAQLAAAAAAFHGQVPPAVAASPTGNPATPAFPLPTSPPAQHGGSIPPAPTVGVGGDAASVQTNVNMGANVPNLGARPVSADVAAGSRQGIGGGAQAGTDVVIGGDARKVVVPQQALARLERHPVLGRLQLQSDASKGGSRTALIGKSGVRMTDTQGVQPGKEGGARGSARKVGGGGSGAGSARAGSSSQKGSAGYADGEGPKPQKKRLVWTPELHERFVRAIDAVGLNQAVPKTLVTIMNVEGLTTEHVKSHLQKYRNSLRKEAVEDLKERNQCTGAAGPSGAASGLQMLGGSRAKLGVGHGAVAGASRDVRYNMLPNRINVHGKPVTGLGSGLGGSAAGNSAVVHGCAPVDQIGGIRVSHGTTVRHETNTTENQESEMRVPLGGALHPGVAAQLVGGGVAGVGPMNVEGGIGGLAENVGSVVQQGENGSENPSGLGGIVEMSQAMGAAPETTKNQSDMMSDVDEANSGAEKKREGGDAGASSNRMESEIREAIGSSSRSRVGSNREGSRSTRQEKELQLELMNEKTLQMQLTLQMMVHRTIALEKRLEQESTDRMQAEASAPGSGRSGRSDRGGRGSEKDDDAVSGGGEGQAQGGSRGAGGGSGDNVDEKGSKNEGNGDGKKDKSDVKVERDGDGMSSKSAIAALLKDQMEMGKVLEQAREIINEQMRGQSEAANTDKDNEEANSREQDDGKKGEGDTREDVTLEDVEKVAEVPEGKKEEENGGKG